jgi:hypothetical protein
MNATEIVAALDLPASAQVDRRVPKTLIIENGAPTATDKRRINEGIEELYWLAALKPTTIGVPEYRDHVREYLEIAVLRLALRVGAKASRLVELVHRAVPYPVLLLVEKGERIGLSLAHKRWSQGEEGRTVVDGAVTAIEWDITRDGRHAAAFRAALALGRQPQGTLHALYDGWIDTLVALQAARRTGIWQVPMVSEHALERREALRDCVRLDVEIARLRAAGAKEKQLARRVELTLELKRVEVAQAAALAKL